MMTAFSAKAEQRYRKRTEGRCQAGIHVLHVTARPSFLADRQRRERRSKPVTVTFGSPFEA
jgi:hypothetical protein